MPPGSKYVCVFLCVCGCSYMFDCVQEGDREEGGVTEWCFGICVGSGDLKCHHHQCCLILRNKLLIWTDNLFRQPLCYDSNQLGVKGVCALLWARVIVFWFVIRCLCSFQVCALRYHTSILRCPMIMWIDYGYDNERPARRRDLHKV